MVDVCGCADEAGVITDIQLYDFYEADTYRKHQNLIPALGDPALSEKEKIAFALDRMRKYFPDLSDRYQKRANEILAGDGKVALFLNDIHLDPIPDTTVPYRGIHCGKEQIATRTIAAVKGDPVFTFDNSLWNALGARHDGAAHQAGLILHEVINEDFSQVSGGLNDGALFHDNHHVRKI